MLHVIIFLTASSIPSPQRPHTVYIQQHFYEAANTETNSTECDASFLRQHSSHTTAWWMDTVWSHYPCCLLISPPFWPPSHMTTSLRLGKLCMWGSKSFSKSLTFTFFATVDVATGCWWYITWYPGSASEAMCKLRALFSTFPSPAAWKINKKLIQIALSAQDRFTHQCLSAFQISTFQKFPLEESLCICLFVSFYPWAFCHVIHYEWKVEYTV